MHRSVIILLALLLAACSTSGHRHYGYHDAYADGDYYYGHADASPWYDPYDSLFWGLRYSYYDPFWHPNFYYGVTYFPRYYGWQSGWSSAYAWRHWHPYSPYYGSYWDHYYAWWRHPPRGPHRHLDGMGGRLAGRQAGSPASPGGPVRYGSARNAAERMAQQRRAGDYVIARDRFPAAGVSRPGADPVWRSRGEPGLPSRHYVPRERLGVIEGGAPMRGDRFERGERSWRGRQDGMPMPPRADRFERGGAPLPSSSRSAPRFEPRGGQDGGRFTPPPVRQQAPVAPSRSFEGRSGGGFNAPRMERSAPPARPMGERSASPRVERSRMER